MYTLHIKKIGAESGRLKETFSILSGDFYNMYHNVITSGDLGESWKGTSEEFFCAFQVSINEEKVCFKKQLPPLLDQDTCVSFDESVTMTFGEFGTYTWYVSTNE